MSCSEAFGVPRRAGGCPQVAREPSGPIVSDLESMRHVGCVCGNGSREAPNVSSLRPLNLLKL